MKVAFLLPVFYKGLCLVEVDVRMVAQLSMLLRFRLMRWDGPVSMETRTAIGWCPNGFLVIA